MNAPDPLNSRITSASKDWEECCRWINMNQGNRFQQLLLRQVLLLIVSDESSKDCLDMTNTMF